MPYPLGHFSEKIFLKYQIQLLHNAATNAVKAEIQIATINEIMINAGIDASDHLIINLTIDPKGMSISLITILSWGTEGAMGGCW